MKSKFKIKYLRLPALLLLLGLGIVVISGLHFFCSKADIQNLVISFGEGGDTFPNGQMEFSPDGVARFRFVGEPAFEAAFDRDQVRKTLWRYQNLADSAPSPSQYSPEFCLAVRASDGLKEWDGHLDFSREILSEREMLALYLGADWAAWRVAPQNLTLSLLRDLIVSIPEKDRRAFLEVVQEDRFAGWEREESRGKAIQFLTWIVSPDAGGDIGLMAAPLPWREMFRVTSPDGKLDAVLVSRTDVACGDLEAGGDAEPQTNLYLLERGRMVENDSPYRSSEIAQYLERLSLECPMVVFGSSKISVSWKNNHEVLVKGESISLVLQRADRFETPLRIVSLEYELQLSRNP